MTLFKTDIYHLLSWLVLQFVLCTAPNIGNMVEHLHYIYNNFFVEFVVKNPLYNPGDQFM